MDCAATASTPTIARLTRAAGNRRVRILGLRYAAQPSCSGPVVASTSPAGERLSGRPRSAVGASAANSVSEASPSTRPQSTAVPNAPGRAIVIAVDATEDSAAALDWTLANVLRAGDVVHLVHVVIDTRTPRMSVGSSSGGGYQWSPQADPALAREWAQRLEEEGRQLVMTTFVPRLRAAQVRYEVEVVKQRGTRSAAGIGEAICSKAGQVGAAMMVIASHGSGVLADYGSVAQYCATNATVPCALLPPSVLREARPEGSVCGGVAVVAVDDLAGLEAAARYAVDNISCEGEPVTVVSVEEPASGPGEEGETSSPEDAHELLRTSVAGWLGKRGGELNLVVLPNTRNTESDSEHSIVGEALCKVTAQSGARCVVLADAGRDNVIRRMMYGNMTTYYLRHALLPVVVLP